MRTDDVPIEAAGVAANYLGDVVQRQGIGTNAKVVEQLLVHLMLGQPEGEHGDLVRKVEQLDAVELADAYYRPHDRADGALTPIAKLLQTEDIHLQQAERLIGDDEEVAATAGGVEEFHAADAVQQFVAFADDGLAVGTEGLARLPPISSSCF